MPQWTVDAEDAGSDVREVEDLVKVLFSRLAFNRAIKFSQECLERFRDAGDSVKEQGTLAILARIYASKGDHRAALNVVGQTLPRCKQSGNKRGEALLLMTQAKVSLHKEGHEEAERVAQQALALFRESQDTRGQAAVLQMIARLHIHGGGNVAAAQKAVEEAIELARRTKDQEGEAKALLGACEAESQMGHLPKALVLGKYAASVQRTRGKTEQEADALLATGSMLMRMGWLNDEVMEVLHQAFELHKQNTKSRRGEAESLVLLAEAFFERGDHKKVQKSAEEAARIFKAMGDMQQEAAALHTAATSYLAQMALGEETEKYWARLVAEDAVERWQAIGDAPEQEALARETLAHLQIQDGDVEAALENTQNIQKMAKQLGDKRLAAAALYITAQAQFQNQAADQAIKAARQAQRMYHGVGDSGALHDTKELIKSVTEFKETEEEKALATKKPEELNEKEKKKLKRRAERKNGSMGVVMRCPAMEFDAVRMITMLAARAGSDNMPKEMALTNAGPSNLLIEGLSAQVQGVCDGGEEVEKPLPLPPATSSTASVPSPYGATSSDASKKPSRGGFSQLLGKSHTNNTSPPEEQHVQTTKIEQKTCRSDAQEEQERPAQAPVSEKQPLREREVHLTAAHAVQLLDALSDALAIDSFQEQVCKCAKESELEEPYLLSSLQPIVLKVMTSVCAQWGFDNDEGGAREMIAAINDHMDGQEEVPMLSQKLKKCVTLMYGGDRSGIVKVLGTERVMELGLKGPLGDSGTVDPVGFEAEDVPDLKELMAQLDAEELAEGCTE